MKKIQQYRIATLGALMAVMLTGCSMMEKTETIPTGVLMTKPLQIDLPPDLRTDADVATPLPKPQLRPAPKPVQQMAIAPANRPVEAMTAAVDAKYRCGNEPVYTLNGRSYNVLPSANGYRAEGKAARYSAKYQGSTTAGCEKYDLHAFTAAHRTLPLPSFVRVTNLQNNKAVIVKVNDRGPFDNDGLIQLSAAASGTLGIGGPGGNAQVRVEALNARNVARVQPRAGVRPAQPARPAMRQNQASANPRRGSANRPPVKRLSLAQAAAVKKAKQSGKGFFVIVKNYPTQADALDMFVRLTSVGLKKTELASAVSQGLKVHQVRVGPLYTQDQIDSVKDTLSSNGLATFKVVEVDL